MSVGKPGFPIAAVSRGKQVIVGLNETFKVGDHDYSKVSLIPDATLIHYIPEKEEENEEIVTNNSRCGDWYTGKVYYSVKDMPMEGSTAIRGAAELEKALTDHYSSDVPARLSIYADGGGDRKNSNFKVQRGLLGLFHKHDFDEIVAARPAANHSFRNPVERCHCIANIGLQSVGMMQSRQDSDFEKEMAKCAGNADVNKACEGNKSFYDGFIKSLDGPKRLLEEVLGNLYLKDEKFTVLDPADDEEIIELEDSLKFIDENLKEAKSFDDAFKCANFAEFYEKHCISRTYFFQVRKCSDSNCPYHKPLRGEVSIEAFPDPEPYEENEVVHYRPGSDPAENFLPSKLENPEKRAHGLPFSPSARTAANVGFTIR